MNGTTTNPAMQTQDKHQRRPGLRIGAAMLLLLVAATVIGMVATFNALSSLEGSWPLRIVVDGEPVVDGLQFGPLPPAHQVALAAIVVLGLLAALVIVPVALICLVAAVMAVVLAILGVPVLAAAAVVLLLLSPLLLLAWWVIKRLS